MISEGSDLLLLVPSLAGLVGGVVLPLLGAVPDGAIMLFSGLGSVEEAQENLAVGVGALAGSTIMLLTISLALSALAGRVDLKDGVANYKGKPKLSISRGFISDLFTTGIGISPEVNNGALIMMVTTVSYLIIQVPASFLTDLDLKEVGKKEKGWALVGLIVCVISFIWYLVLQYKMSINLENFDRMIYEMKVALDEDKLSLQTCIYDFMAGLDVLGKPNRNTDGVDKKESQALLSTKDTTGKALPLLKALLQGPFKKYDKDGNRRLEKDELKVCLMDLNVTDPDHFVDGIITEFDKDNDGVLSFNEFAYALYVVFKDEYKKGNFVRRLNSVTSAPDFYAVNEDDDEEEEEEIPDDLLELSPKEQQTAIKKRAFSMLFIGTVLVVLFSDPMVEVIGEVSNRLEISAFYVSFCLVPLASNASEVIASQFYAKKKTSNSITVSLSALEGAAAMNNTFCLAIFMGLIYFRGLAWHFTAETIAILSVQLIVGFYLRGKTLSTVSAYVILLLFPLSIALVAILEEYGFD